MPQRPSSHRFSALVEFWYPQRDAMRWVLATLLDAQGSSYRKTGAQLLINDLGQWFGLISGGCLEAEIVRLAQAVFDDGVTREHQFDSYFFDDTPSAATGCGGVLTVRLQAITSANHYLQLPALHAATQHREMGCYLQAWDNTTSDAKWLPASEHVVSFKRAQQYVYNERRWLATPLDLPPHVLIVGGGVDARPLAEMATVLGWQVSVCDPRVTAARRSDFSPPTQLFACAANQLPLALLRSIDAAMVMTHNIALDAEAIHVLQEASGLRYLGLLGPPHRRDRVLQLAGAPSSHCRIAGPAGLKLGGDLPESVALSIIAEIHAVLHDASAQSFCQLLNTERSS